MRKDDGSLWVVTCGGKSKIRWEPYKGDDDLDSAVAKPARLGSAGSLVSGANSALVGASWLPASPGGA